MFKNNFRSCDVCGSEIPKRERYVVRKIPKHRLRIIEELTPGIEPDMRDGCGFGGKPAVGHLPQLPHEHRCSRYEDDQLIE